MLTAKQTRSRWVLPAAYDMRRTAMPEELEYECLIRGPGDVTRSRKVFAAPSLDAAKRVARDWSTAVGMVPEPTQLILLRAGATVWAWPLAEFP